MQPGQFPARRGEGREIGGEGNPRQLALVQDLAANGRESERPAKCVHWRCLTFRVRSEICVQSRYLRLGKFLSCALWASALSQLQEPGDLLARDGGRVFEKLLQRRVALDVIDQAVDANGGAFGARRPAPALPYGERHSKVRVGLCPTPTISIRVHLRLNSSVRPYGTFEEGDLRPPSNFLRVIRT